MYCSMKVPQFYFFLMDKMVYSFFKPLKSKQQSDQKFAMEMKKIRIFSKIFGSKCLLLPNTEFCRNILHNGKFLDQFHGCLARFSSTSLEYVWMHWSHFFSLHIIILFITFKYAKPDEFEGLDMLFVHMSPNNQQYFVFINNYILIIFFQKIINIIPYYFI